MYRVKKIINLFFVVFLYLFLCKCSFATDFKMECDEKNCTPSQINGFFNENIIWFPGYSQSNSVSITNKSTTDQYIGNKAINTNKTSEFDLSEVLDLEIFRKSTNKVIWKGSLKKFFSLTESSLGILKPKETEKYIYSVKMRDVGNEYQGKSAKFDLVFMFVAATLLQEKNSPFIQASEGIGSRVSIIAPDSYLNTKTVARISQNLLSEIEIQSKKIIQYNKTIFYTSFYIIGITFLIYIYLKRRK